MEWLKDLLGEELFAQVSAKLGDTKILKNDGNYLPKEKFNEKLEENKILKEQVEQLKKSSGDVEKILKDHTELKSQYDALQNESKAQLEAKEKEIGNIVKRIAIEKALTSAGAAHPDLLMSKFNLDTLEVENGNIKGFDDMLKPSKETYSNMFTEKKVVGNDLQGGGTPPSPKSNLQQLTEQYEQARKDGKTAIAVSLKDQARQDFRLLGEVLGLFQLDSWQFGPNAPFVGMNIDSGRPVSSQKNPSAYGSQSYSIPTLSDNEIETRIAERIEAKRRKDFKRADEIRAELHSFGIIIEDKPDGTSRWKR